MLGRFFLNLTGCKLNLELIGVLLHLMCAAVTVDVAPGTGCLTDLACQCDGRAFFVPVGQHLGFIYLRPAERTILNLACLFMLDLI